MDFINFEWPLQDVPKATHFWIKYLQPFHYSVNWKLTLEI